MVGKFGLGLLAVVASYGAVGFAEDAFHSKTYSPFNQNPTQWDVDQARRTAYDESRLVTGARDDQLRARTTREWLDSVDRERKHQSHQWQAENDARMLEDRLRDNRIQEERERSRRQQEEEKQRRRVWDDSWQRENSQQRYDVDRAPYVVPMPVRSESARLREARERAAVKAKRAEERKMAQKEKEEKGEWAYRNWGTIRENILKSREDQRVERLKLQKERMMKKQENDAKAARLVATTPRPKAGPGSVSSGKASLEERRKAAGMNADGTINHNAWR